MTHGLRPPSGMSAVGELDCISCPLCLCRKPVNFQCGGGVQAAAERLGPLMDRDNDDVRKIGNFLRDEVQASAAVISAAKTRSRLMMRFVRIALAFRGRKLVIGSKQISSRREKPTTPPAMVLGAAAPVASDVIQSPTPLVPVRYAPSCVCGSCEEDPATAPRRSPSLGRSLSPWLQFVPRQRSRGSPTLTLPPQQRLRQ